MVDSPPKKIVAEILMKSLEVANRKWSQNNDFQVRSIEPNDLYIPFLNTMLGDGEITDKQAGFAFYFPE